jgi:hypothetical protein
VEADEDKASKEEDDATEEAVKGRPEFECGAIDEEGRHMSGLVSAAIKNAKTNRQ